MESDMLSALPQAAWSRGEGILRVSIWDYTARLGTLNTMIPNLFDVA